MSYTSSRVRPRITGIILTYHVHVCILAYYVYVLMYVLMYTSLHICPHVTRLRPHISRMYPRILRIRTYVRSHVYIIAYMSSCNTFLHPYISLIYPHTTRIRSHAYIIMYMSSRMRPHITHTSSFIHNYTYIITYHIYVQYLKRFSHTNANIKHLFTINHGNIHNIDGLNVHEIYKNIQNIRIN